MKCPKCESEKVIVAQDKRGVYELRCGKCGAYIKKISTAEAKDRLAQAAEAEPEEVEDETVNERDRKMVCKYCTENVFIRRGRLGTIYTPIESKFCPMCGRKKRPEDKKY